MMQKKRSQMKLMQKLRSQLAVSEGQRLELSRQLEQLRSEEGLNRGFLLLDAMMEGFGLAEVILDENGRPYDFRIVEINNATGRFLGISPDNAKGITARQLFPNVDDSWIELFGEVVLNRK
jgi:PAS domain-containing protein